MYGSFLSRLRRSSCYYALTISVAFAWGLSSLPAIAETSVNAYDVRLKADRLEGNLNDEDSTWVLSGNVKLEQDTTRMNAEQMTVNRKKGTVVDVVAHGQPVRFEQKAPNEVTASARSIRYLIVEGKLILEGDVELVQQGNTVRSASLQYDLTKGELMADSSENDDAEQIEFVLDTSE